MRLAENEIEKTLAGGSMNVNVSYETCRESSDDRHCLSAAQEASPRNSGGDDPR